MKEHGRLRGCLCLLLCLIDGLAKKSNPVGENNRDRYCNYLKKKLEERGINDRLHVIEKNDLMHLADLIYEYFRCYFIHEGDSREQEHYEIQIEYEDSGRFKLGGKILMDLPRDKMIVRADWLITLLIDIIEDEIKA